MSQSNVLYLHSLVSNWRSFMEPLHLEDYLPFVFITGLLLLGSMLLTSHTPVLQFTLNLFLLPVIHLPVIGTMFLLEGFVLGGLWCYTFYQKIQTSETEGTYICTRCQAHNHPDSTKCEFCFHDMDYTFELRVRTIRRKFPYPNKAGVCSVCGKAGHYYRRDRWFCFHHRNQGR
jgi:ribosomal protein L40E